MRLSKPLYSFNMTQDNSVLNDILNKLKDIKESLIQDLETNINELEQRLQKDFATPADRIFHQRFQDQLKGLIQELQKENNIKLETTKEYINTLSKLIVDVNKQHEHIQDIAIKSRIEPKEQFDKIISKCLSAYTKMFREVIKLGL